MFGHKTELCGSERKPQAATCLNNLHLYGLNTAAEQKQTLLYTTLSPSLAHKYGYMCTQRGSGGSVFMLFIIGLIVKLYPLFLPL